MCEGTIPVDSNKFIMCVKGSGILIIDAFIILVDMLFKSTLVFALILLTTARISFESIGSKTYYVDLTGPYSDGKYVPRDPHFH